jgi:hypothetical protein
MWRSTALLHQTTPVSDVGWMVTTSETAPPMGWEHDGFSVCVCARACVWREPDSLRALQGGWSCVCVCASPCLGQDLWVPAQDQEEHGHPSLFHGGSGRPQHQGGHADPLRSIRHPHYRRVSTTADVLHSVARCMFLPGSRPWSGFSWVRGRCDSQTDRRTHAAVSRE